MKVLRDHEPSSSRKADKKKWYNLFYVDPTSTKNGIWSFIVIIVIYLFQLQISLTLGFGPKFWSTLYNGDTNEIGYGFLIVVMGIDLIISFHKGYYAFGRGKIID